MKGWTIVVDYDCLCAVPVYIDTEKTNYYPDTDIEIETDNRIFECYEMIIPSEELCRATAENLNERWPHHRCELEKFYRLDHHGKLPDWDNSYLRRRFFNYIIGVIGCSEAKAYENWEKKYSNIKSNE